MAWQNDWATFVQVLADELRRDAPPTSLSDEFGAKVVRWSGILLEKLLDDLAPTVTIGVSPTQIEVEPHGPIVIGDLSVPARRDAVSAWDGIPIGASVTFTAVLGGRTSPFAPIEVMELNSGRRVAMIRLSEGRPDNADH